MSISAIPALQNKRQDYVNRAAHARNQIARCERAHETLSAFKTVVTQAQEDFHNINSSKSSILSGVESVKQNSLIAQQYHTGMSNIFTGIGNRIIGLVYSGLLVAISARLRSYTTAVGDYEDDVELYERKIRETDRQIEETRKAEELAKQIVGGVI